MLAGTARKVAKSARFAHMQSKTWVKGTSHEKLHAAPSKKQPCFLEGALPLRNIKETKAFLEAPVVSQKVLRGTFDGLPLMLPS